VTTSLHLLPCEQESERKLRFFRNLRFFKEASRQHINDFNHSAAGSKYRSSSSPDIHKQLTEAEGLESSSSDVQPGEQEEKNHHHHHHHHQQQQKKKKKKKKKKQQQQQSSEQGRKEEKQQQKKPVERRRGSSARDRVHRASPTASASEANNSKTKEKGKEKEKEKEKEMSKPVEETPSLATTASGTSDSTAKDGARMAEAEAPPPVSIQEQEQAEDDKCGSLNNNSSSSSGGSSNSDGPQNKRERRKSTSEQRNSYREALSVNPGTAAMLSLRDSNGGARALLDVQQQRAKGNGVLKKSEGDLDSKREANSTSGGKKSSEPEREKEKEKEKKKGGLIARYKQLVAGLDKEKSPDIIKSYTESAVGRSKKKKEREEAQEQPHEPTPAWDKTKSESRKGVKKKEKKEEHHSKKKHTDKLTTSQTISSAHHHKKKKKKTKGSKENNEESRKEKRARKASISACAKQQEEPTAWDGFLKGTQGGPTTSKVQSLIGDPSAGARRRPQDVDEGARASLRKLSEAPPAPSNGEVGVTAIRQRLMTGEPVTAVLYPKVPWATIDRVGPSKPTRALNHKSSRSTKADAPDSHKESTAAKGREGRNANGSGGESARTGNENGSGKEERKADILLCGGSDDLIVVDEDDEGSKKPNSGPESGAAAGDRTKLADAGELTNGEESEEEDWDKELQLENESKVKVETKKEDEEVVDNDEEEDWEKEFGQDQEQQKIVEEEDWEKEFGDQEEQKEQEKGKNEGEGKGEVEEEEERKEQLQVAKKQGSAGAAAESESEEDWEKDFASADDVLDEKPATTPPVLDKALEGTSAIATGPAAMEEEAVAENDEGRGSDACDGPPKGHFSVFRIQFLHSRSSKWLERELLLALTSQKPEDELAVPADSLRTTKKEGPLRLVRSNRELRSSSSKEGKDSSLASSAR
jgi:hypothetical protein